jgi:hypothetical protein
MLLGRVSLFEDLSNRRSHYEITSQTTSSQLDNMFYSDFIQFYNSQQKLNILVRGSEFRYAGQQIEINFPSSDASKIPNKQRKGKYLVKSITHSLTGTGSNTSYIQRMVLLKNAYEISDNINLLKASRKNIAS